MIKHLIAGVERGFRLHRPGRSLLILPDDVFLVSFRNLAIPGYAFFSSI